MDRTRPQPICTLYPFIFDNYILCFPAEFAYADGPFLQLPVQLCVTWIKVNAVLHHGRQRPNANDAKTVHLYNYFRKWKFCDRTSGTRGHVKKKIVNTDSNDFNIIKSVCVDELSKTDKTIIEGDLFTTSDNPNSDLEKIKRDEYNRKRREKRRLEKENKTN